KRERVLAVLAKKAPDAIPSGFSLHFPRESAFGQAAVQAHLRFFRETDTDILKIMNENLVPNMGPIKTPDDWRCIRPMSLASPFLQAQLELTRRILEGCDRPAYLVGTVHGITASTIHPIEACYGYGPVRELLCAHLREKPQPVLDAMARISEAMCLLSQKYIELGVDGVYYASLGGERRYFTDEEFARWIAPFDQAALAAIREAGGHTFLHICKDGLNMERYASFAPLADVVNWGVYETGFSLEQGRALFPDSAIMGGLANRSGVVTGGTEEELSAAVKKLVRSQQGLPFILGADCTLPTEIPYEKIRLMAKAARDTAEN
ncbi:MAG: uroporphyrinogen decarboxylase family protein, partial [Oscillospiraceae bacterium]|nr:uroporphyrinogen decarboxylase family protein [Oscillospiraceae bacterium]